MRCTGRTWAVGWITPQLYSFRSSQQTDRNPRTLPPTTSHSQADTSMSAYEVERKFLLTPKSRSFLLSTALAAAAPVRIIEFVAEYFDDVNLTLTQGDLWLRQRQRIWQLKQPVTTSGAQSHRCDMTIYREVEGESAVWSALAVYGVEQAKVTCYARLDTRRTSFQINFDGMTVEVVLDECTSASEHGELEKIDKRFTYTIGEVEVLVSSPGDLDGAQAVIDRFFDLHGLSSTSSQLASGKLLQYIKMYRPSHYNKLVRAGVVG
jgi:CYTH domain